MLDWWRLHPRGHVVIGPTEAGYLPGSQAVGRQTLDCVAWVPAKDVLARDDLAEPLASLFDHLLGSDGEPGGIWLSDGGGRNAAWLAIGGRVQRQFALGYAPEAAARDPHSYLAWGMRTFLARRHEVNAADPGLERLLATTMFDPAFWQRRRITQRLAERRAPRAALRRSRRQANSDSSKPTPINAAIRMNWSCSALEIAAGVAALMSVGWLL